VSDTPAETANPGPIESAAELLAHAHRIEADAAERYGLLAEQMETHNNPDVAKLFRKLEWVEGLHADKIRDRAGETPLPALGPLDGKWPGDDSPEAVDLGEAHYLMTPFHALQMALKAEQNAFAFYDRLAQSATDPEIRQLATEFAEEEREHVDLVLKELKKYPPPDKDWSEDPDPARSPG
jgi:rubrerythrin